MKNVSDTYQRITDLIIEQLEAGTKPWVRPWRGSTRPTSIMPRRSSGEAYRGINVLMLWIASQIHGYEDTTWMTYRQAKDLGGQVIKGESGSLVIKYGTFAPKDQNAEADRSIPYLKGYTVFNVEQIENLPAEYYSPAEPMPTKPVPHNETVDNFVRKTGAIVHYGGTKACYRPGQDDILMPDRERFLSDTHLFSTLMHEIGHWSGAKHRLDREMSGRFGDNAYAVEELIAELSAAFLCADLGVAHDPRENTAAYIENWLAVMKADKRAIITAAAKAQAVADYLHGLNITNELEAA